MKTKITLFLLASVLLIGYSSCKKEMPNGSLSSTVDQNQPDVQYTLVLPATTEQYYDSKIGNINEKATLGRVLFYDGHLSANNVTACASCHKQELAFADNTPTSKGYLGLTTRRNSPPIQNLVDNGRNGSSSDTVFFSGSSLFWDGRESNVRNLILRPISNHIEMGMEDVSVIPGKLAKLPYYADLFTKAFGTPGISQERITEAMALFIASIKTGNSKFEQYNKGNGTLSTLEDKGRSLFNSKYNCASCHDPVSTGGYFQSSNFMDNGLDSEYTDRGLGEVTNFPEDYGKFKAPKLHNIALTAPYMHDGRLKTLDDVLEHYNHNIKGSVNLDRRLMDTNKKPKRMEISDDDKQALIAFMNTFTDNTMITDSKFSNPFRVK